MYNQKNKMPNSNDKSGVLSRKDGSTYHTLVATR
jgi:hypothetical protein